MFSTRLFLPLHLVGMCLVKPEIQCPLDHKIVNQEDLD